MGDHVHQLGKPIAPILALPERLNEACGDRMQAASRNHIANETLVTELKGNEVPLKPEGLIHPMPGPQAPVLKTIDRKA